MTDAIQALAHDHRELNGLLVAVHEALSRIDRGQSKLEDEAHEIKDGVEVFREALLEHFAREQEGVLPFVLSRFADVASRIDRLIGEHDRIADCLDKLVTEVARVDAESDISRFRAELSRFDELYASHAKTELAFFADIMRRFDGDVDAARQLQALLDEP